ncbi:MULTISPECIES: membrane protein insertion efficiency factor YidD [Kineococcus]|uniref:membrane protein insertion efficiency factor YidD n=1 Tax=unclassified Kineococcus TaxID=2621656 RepID=UPI001F57F4C4|nr:membrane protein insertion efficiency factor YidD [Kineococcus sp. TRM81007]MCI2238308.1 membrane protein insertion efficiency factor YidD [Kineococcus sp. TRM81007]MCI3924020.1 membrane protein insertion efficiency factor YidD [Paenibacillus sp. TRM 82003]
MTSPAARAFDALCDVYQRRISPRKGYACAHRVAHGGDSCSGAVRSIVRSRGLLGGAVPSAVRFLACYQAASLLMAGGGRGVCCCGPIPIPFRF